MLRSRLIPVLLLADGALVKTVQFKPDKYLGDPLNAVKIFNDLVVDELVILDICATRRQSNPDFPLLERIAAESQIPICYGGGITQPFQVRTLVAMGIEKVAINSAAFTEPSLLYDSAQLVGSQSIVLSLDVKTKGVFRKTLSLFNHTSSSFYSHKLTDFLAPSPNRPFGELLVQFVDRDGMYTGYDLESVSTFYPLTSTPCSILGGASSLSDISLLNRKFGPIGCAASSIFLLKGPLRAPLIQYPSRQDKLSLFR